MAEWQQDSDQRQQKQQQESPTLDKSLPEECDEEPFDVSFEPADSTDMQQAEDGDGAEDDFCGFGDEFEADFDDFDEAPFTVATPAIVTASEEEEEQSRPSIDTVLARTSLLFVAPEVYESGAETIHQCLTQIFNNHDTLPTVPEVPDQSSALLTPGELKSCLDTSVSTSKALATLELEPRLIQNVLLVGLSTTLPDDVRMRLLTPLSELSTEEAQILGEVPPTAALYDIEQVRLISNSSEPNTPAQLSRVLCSLNALIADKEQEVARRKDAVLAYNQVIQTLVAQASKLH
ncbi:hypothetical protein GGI09_002968 [Coemansia sp. S100]|nr:hypothetical protein LPJ71_003313 [Coemansia sp. S17]KAJ2099092.1 hypothetical protein GGI09_002968 [Coemansia sp. S100]KAJ2104671.1 hypothetical protein GGI16_002683 [Coemansia sp. S142-1]